MINDLLKSIASLEQTEEQKKQARLEMFAQRVPELIDAIEQLQRVVRKEKYYDSDYAAKAALAISAGVVALAKLELDDTK